MVAGELEGASAEEVSDGGSDVSDGVWDGVRDGASDGVGDSGVVVRLGVRVGLGRVAVREGSRLAVREPEPDGRPPPSSPHAVNVRATVRVSAGANPHRHQRAPRCAAA